MPKRAIGVCDILGFKSRLEKDGLLKTLYVYKRIFIGSIYHAVFQEAPTPEDDVADLSELQLRANVDLLWASDSVFVVGRDDTEESLLRVITVMQWMLFDSIVRGLALRAAVAWGEIEVSVSKSIYIGPGLCDAIEWEKRQEWIGACLTPSAQLRLPKDTSGWPIVRYDVPVKNVPCGMRQPEYAVDWTLGIHLPPFTDNEFRATFSNCPEAKPKVENTLCFHRRFCRRCHPATGKMDCQKK